MIDGIGLSGTIKLCKLGANLKMKKDLLVMENDPHNGVWSACGKPTMLCRMGQ